MDSLVILKLEVYYSFDNIGGYFFTIWIKQLDHYVIHLLLQDFSAQSFFKNLFEGLLVDLPSSLLI